MWGRLSGGCGEAVFRVWVVCLVGVGRLSLEGLGKLSLGYGLYVWWVWGGEVVWRVWEGCLVDVGRLSEGVESF